MRKEYQEELENLKLKMEYAESFANKLPIFEKIIIQKKYVESDFHLSFGDRLGDSYVGWDITRRHWTKEEMTNYEGDFEGYKVLFKIYNNSYSVYDLPVKFDIEAFLTADLYFYYDSLNSTYYVPDELITKFSEKYAEWYKQAIVKSGEFRKQKEIDELKKKLEKLQS